MGDVFIVENGNESIRAEVNRLNNTFQISMNGVQYQVEALEVEQNVYSLLVGEQSFEVAVRDDRLDYRVYLPNVQYSMKVWNENRMGQTRGIGLKGFQGTGQITAPMPGKVVKILVKKGEEVEEGSGLIVIEAMKMENELKSPLTGIIEKIHVKEGTAVEGNELLIEIC